MVNVLAQILKALLIQKEAAVPAEMDQLVVSDAATAIARSLASGAHVAVLLGNSAQQHPQASQLASIAQQIADLCGAKFGYLGEAANSVGGYLAGAVPGDGMNAMQMLENPRKAYLLLNVEPELDMHNPQLAIAAMKQADMVVALSAYKHHAMAYADVLLPIAPFTETSGTFVNTEARTQSFKGAVKPLGDARPAWKVLRVLGNLLDVVGFDYDTSEAIRNEALSTAPCKLDNHIEHVALDTKTVTGLQRVTDVPIYFADALVRRAASLQKTHDAAAPCARLNGDELQKLGLHTGDVAKITQGNASVTLKVQQDDQLPCGVVRIAAGHPATADLGAMFGEVSVERA